MDPSVWTQPRVAVHAMAGHIISLVAPGKALGAVFAALLEAREAFHVLAAVAFEAAGEMIRGRGVASGNGLSSSRERRRRRGGRHRRRWGLKPCIRAQPLGTVVATSIDQHVRERQALCILLVWLTEAAEAMRVFAAMTVET